MNVDICNNLTGQNVEHFEPKVSVGLPPGPHAASDLHDPDQVGLVFDVMSLASCRAARGAPRRTVEERKRGLWLEPGGGGRQMRALCQGGGREEGTGQQLLRMAGGGDEELLGNRCTRPGCSQVCAALPSAGPPQGSIQSESRCLPAHWIRKRFCRGPGGRSFLCYGATAVPPPVFPPAARNVDNDTSNLLWLGWPEVSGTKLLP